MRQCVNTDETLKYQIWYVNAPKKENFFLTLQNIPFPILPSFEDALQVIKQLKNLENIETITNEPFIQKEKQSSFQQGPGSDKTIFPVFNFLKITSFIKEISFALKKQTVKAIKDKILTLISKKSKPDSNQKSKDYIFEEYSCDNFNCRKLEYPNYILFKLMGTINNQNFPLLSKLLLNLSHFDSKIIILDFKNVNEISDSCLVNLYFFSLIQNEIIKKNNYYQKLTQGLLLTSIPDSIKPIFARVNLPYFVFKNIEAALKHITKNENDLKEPKSKNETEKEVTFYKECNYKGLKVKLKEMPTYFSLKFEGGITQDCVDFMDELLAKFNQKQKTVILDIANLKYISEEIGFYMLNAYLNSAKAHRYNILLTGVNPVYKNKFPHFPIYSDENTAIRNHLQIKKEETLKLLRKNEEFIIKGEVPSQKSTPDTKKQFNELQRAAQEIVSSINEQQLLLRKLNEEINILGKKLQND
jgi:anti-anti-sigma regulatory factor